MTDDTQKFLEEIRSNLRGQDERATRDPLYVVFERVKLSADPRCTTDWEYGDTYDSYLTVGDSREDLINYAKENELELPQDYLRIDEDELFEFLHDQSEHLIQFYYHIVDRFVTACFTEVGAQTYLNANKHNLSSPHIFVTSLYRNYEMITIREMLLGEVMKQ